MTDARNRTLPAAQKHHSPSWTPSQLLIPSFFLKVTNLRVYNTMDKFFASLKFMQMESNDISTMFLPSFTQLTCFLCV